MFISHDNINIFIKSNNSYDDEKASNEAMKIELTTNIYEKY